MWRVHRLDRIIAKKPAKLLDSKSLTLGFSRKQIWPVFLPKPRIVRGPEPRPAVELPILRNITPQVPDGALPTGGLPTFGNICPGHSLGVGGGEKGYQKGGEVVPWQGSSSESAFPSSQSVLYGTARRRQGRAVVGRGEANP